MKKVLDKEMINKEEETVMNKCFAEYKKENIKEDRKNMNNTVRNNVKKAAVAACAVGMLTGCGNRNNEADIKKDDTPVITSDDKADTVIVAEPEKDTDENEVSTGKDNTLTMPEVKDNTASVKEDDDIVYETEEDPYVRELNRLKNLLAQKCVELVLKQANYDLAKGEYMSALSGALNLIGRDSVLTMGYEEASKEVNGTVNVSKVNGEKSSFKVVKTVNGIASDDLGNIELPNQIIVKFLD